MCRRVACRTCGKPTYAGCGMHVEQVLAGILQSQRCSCPPKERASGGWLGRLFGRR
ncbi:hypothetical protein [Kitasatospora cathayae]|uniref:Uncharacterized protein n=1 Tax=Kitasatospora cathayae TaxID=3004092 RepID=A0ABY7QFA6_9ACTN|nr:hypothetical protein [Kitasatospora sp. HUAS 3-15]WBP90786.1 hypothetical protein O1G21_36265 [Kitasatospora sp. HUAS 3-15]